MAKFNTRVQLGNLSGKDGNAFSIMGKVSGALKESGATKEEVIQYQEESMSGDYDNLLKVAGEWVEVL